MPDRAPMTDAELLAAAAKAQRSLPDAPAAWQRAAIDLWPLPASQALGAALRLVQAVLRFDSAAAAPWAAGVRSGGAAERQWLFAAEGHDVDLRAAPLPCAVHLSGQLLGPEPGRAVWLEPAQGSTQRVAIDSQGGFDFGALAPGRYRLGVELAELRIELPPIELDGG